jgi:hypothetical protein
MAKGYEEATRLSPEEVISKLDGFLNLIKKDYSFLWKGSSSLINKYGASPTLFGMKTEFGEDNEFNKFIPLSNYLPSQFQREFNTLGIAKEDGEFKFYLDNDIPDFQLYETGKEVYDALIKQFDLNEKDHVHHFAQRIYTNLEKILLGEFHDKLVNLKEKLEIK